MVCIIYYMVYIIYHTLYIIYYTLYTQTPNAKGSLKIQLSLPWHSCARPSCCASGARTSCFGEVFGNGFAKVFVKGICKGVRKRCSQ